MPLGIPPAGNEKSAARQKILEVFLAALATFLAHLAYLAAYLASKSAPTKLLLHSYI